MRVYIIMATPEASASRISQEAYTSFKEAETFILSRHGCLKQLSTHKWRDENYMEYQIFEVDVK